MLDYLTFIINQMHNCLGLYKSA